jgi:hypothetical protein
MAMVDMIPSNPQVQSISEKEIVNFLRRYGWLCIFILIAIPLLILLSPAEAANFNVRDYGAVGNGTTNDQAAIQAAIDAAASQGGGNVVLDNVGNAGKYLTGNLTLKSGVSLVINPGVEIVASRYIGDWDNHGCNTSGGGCTCDSDLMAPLVFADMASNVAVRGGGTLVGTAYQMRGANGQLCDWQVNGSGPGMIFYGDVSNAVIENITLEEAQTVGIVLAESDHVLIDNVTINSSTDWLWDDALDIFGAQDVTVKNSHIQSGDDNIALKVSCSIYAARHMMSELDCNHLEPVRNIVIEGNTVYAPYGGSGLKIGWEVSGEVSDVLWKDNIVRRGTADPVSIWVRTLDEAKTHVHNIYYENNRFDDGQLIGNLSINGPQIDCQYYEIYWNGELVDRNVQTGDECGGTTCNCTPWQDQDCGQGTCTLEQMYQTRSCTPSGCNTEARCVANSICVSIPADINLDGETDALDLQTCVAVSLGIEKDPFLTQRCDLNSDNQVNRGDFELVLDTLMGS